MGLDLAVYQRAKHSRPEFMLVPAFRRYTASVLLRRPIITYFDDWIIIHFNLHFDNTILTEVFTYTAAPGGRSLARLLWKEI